MRILITTEVNGHFKRVFERFDQQLFEALRPPLLQVHIERFDGSLPGQLLAVRLGPQFMSAQWASRITARKIFESEAYFVDEGELLPPPLCVWKHVHRVQAIGPAQTAIHDEVTFRTPHRWLDGLIAPLIYLFLWARCPVYRRYFR